MEKLPYLDNFNLEFRYLMILFRVVLDLKLFFQKNNSFLKRIIRVKKLDFYQGQIDHKEVGFNILFLYQ